MTPTSGVTPTSGLRPDARRHCVKREERLSNLSARSFLQPKFGLAGSGIADLVTQHQRLLEDLPGLRHALLSAENLTQEMTGFRRSPKKPALGCDGEPAGLAGRFLGTNMVA